jgi:hypothetical protein
MNYRKSFRNTTFNSRLKRRVTDVKDWEFRLTSDGKFINRFESVGRMRKNVARPMNKDKPPRDMPVLFR